VNSQTTLTLFFANGHLCSFGRLYNYKFNFIAKRTTILAAVVSQEDGTVIERSYRFIVNDWDAVASAYWCPEPGGNGGSIGPSCGYFGSAKFVRESVLKLVVRVLALEERKDVG